MTDSSRPQQGPLSSRLSRRGFIRAAGITSAAATVAVVGHGYAWGAEPGTFPVKPYTLTPGALEAFSITERLHVRIDGFGEDVVALTGMALFQRSTPRLAPEARAAGARRTFATSVHDVEFRNLQAVGTSSVFGNVRVSSSGNGQEKAQVTPNAETLARLASGGPIGGTTQGNSCNAVISPRIELSEYGESLSTGQNAVELGSVVSVVPPVGDVARTRGSVPLVNEAGEQVGTLLAADIEIGPVLHRISAM